MTPKGHTATRSRAARAGARPKGSPATGATFTVLQFNMWGWIGFKGSPEIGHAVARSVRDRKPAVVTLNEACRAQVEAAVQDLASWGLSYQFHHDFILRRETKAGSCDFGNAIMWKSEEPVEREPEIFLTIPTREQARKLLAVKVDCLRLPTVICATHLTSGDSEGMARARKPQVVQIADYIQGWKERGVEVILGGDFNEQPDSPLLDPLYLPEYGGGSSGSCHEVTCLGTPNARIRRKPFKPTHDAGRKYDYIFMTTGYQPRGATVTHSDSDHHPYYGRIL